jgi:AcrR family transcriptional regulator
MDGRIAKGDATRSLIVEKATVAFAQAGYAATSIEDVLVAAGISRGALYHHFDDKKALFTAVLEAVEERVAKTVVSASEGISDPLKALHAGSDAWLKLGNDPIVKQIALIDAPAVLGWEKWRELDRRFGFGLLRASVQNIALAGYIREQSVDIFAHMLLAALLEVALLVARDDRPPTALRNGSRAVHELIDKLAAVPKKKGTASSLQVKRTRRKS